MKKIFLFALFFLCIYRSGAQCLVNTLKINTGYDPVTDIAIPGGANGATPVPDPHWKLTAVSPAVAAAIPSTPIPGLIALVPVCPADIVTTRVGWASNPNSSWISCINTNLYTTDGLLGTTVYDMTLSRSFKTCSDDSIKLDLYIANDNYIPSMDVDGIPLAFSQSAGLIPAYFSGYTHFTQHVFLPAGTHSLNLISVNYNTTGLNGVGVDIYGTVSSVTSLNTLVSEAISGCTFACSTPICDDTLHLQDTVTECIGTTFAMPASITGPEPVISVLWSPVTGLSDPAIISPTLTAATSGWYYLTVKSLLPANLVLNGDFSAGNVGFSSSYTYSAPPSTILLEGHYSVYTNPNGVHTGFTSFGDHTTGTGNMMIINGASSPVDVWCQTISVVPNTDYNFSAWFANCSSVTTGPDVPILQFKINGVLQGVPTTVTAAPGTWVNFFVTWNSGPSTSATICINDALTTASGNDFVIDDISFQQVCAATDSVYLNVASPATDVHVHDTAVCAIVAPITLTAPTGFAGYTWSTGGTGTSISAATTGTYWVRTAMVDCSIRVDTFHVVFNPMPTVSLGNDTGFCTGHTYTLFSPQPAGSLYTWSTGSTSPSIPVSSSGAYMLTVTNSYGCSSSDIVNVVVSPPPVVNLGPDTIICSGSALTLHSLVSYTSPTYLWSDLSSGATKIATNSGIYWLQVTVGGCSSADTIHVEIIYDTFTLHNVDTAICLGRSVQALVNGAPGATYQWAPTAGIPASDMSSPLITPDTSAMYVITVFMTGCPPLKDSFFIDVQPIPDVFVSNYRNICKYDTIHLIPFIKPLWYTGFSYSWWPIANINDPYSRNVIFTAGDTTQMILTVTTSAGCKGMDSTIIFTHPVDFATVRGDTTICPHDSVRLWAAGGVSYKWSPAMYLDSPLIARPLARAITNETYTVLATSEYGCHDTLSMRLSVHADAVINMPDSFIISSGGSYQIIPRTNCTSFIWSPPGGLDNRYLSNPVAKPDISTRYIVRGTTEWGCATIDTINIIIDPTTIIALPNAFAPESGKLYILKKGIVHLRNFRIYNRWGNLVFQTTNIEEGWDGTYKGTPQSFGVFVYTIEAETATGELITKAGNVTLLR